MTDQKKDLTGIMEFAEGLEESGHAAPDSGEPPMAEIPIEKVDSFESLDEYAVSHPVPPESSSESPVSDSNFQASSNDFATTPPPDAGGAVSADDFLVSDGGPGQSSSETMSVDLASSSSGSSSSDLPPPSLNDDFQVSAPQDNASFGNSDFAVSTPAEGGSSDFPPSDFSDASSSPSSPPSSATPDFTPSEFTIASPETSGDPGALAPPGSEPLPSSGLSSAANSDNSLGNNLGNNLDGITSVAPPPSTTSAEDERKLRPTLDYAKKADQPLDNVKKYSENLSVGKPTVQAAFPFSLLIEGHMLPEEKEKLLDILTRENMGIREIDLEPQLLGGKVLIPRISEFAGVLLVQALRGTKAQIRLGPSDTIFATKATRAEESEQLSSEIEENASSITSDIAHPAENMPITSEDHLPELQQYTLIDTITASATLKSSFVEADRSTDYHELVEALQRELKYKAFRRGACAVLNFKVQLNTLSSPTHYRLLAFGSAVKPSMAQSWERIPQNFDPTLP